MSDDVVIPAPAASAEHPASTMYGVVKRSADILHAGAPRIVARAYIRALSFLSRRLPLLADRIQSSVCRHACRYLSSRSRCLSPKIPRFSLHPHLGEFDQAALFKRRLGYETPVFDWLVDHARMNYDIIVEIGANIGVYTVFFDALIKKLPKPRLKKIIAFGPSQEPFRRLLENLRANNAEHVVALQAAVGPVSGPQPFFEPEGHLTNGLFVREFAALFSSCITETPVVVVGAAELEEFLRDAGKALIKIDVEGFEPVLVIALAGLIARYRPDLIIEVLADTVELQRIPMVQGCPKYLFTSHGLEESDRLFANPHYRDWLLRF